MHLVMAGVTAPSHIYPSLSLITELVSRRRCNSFSTRRSLSYLSS